MDPSSRLQGIVSLSASAYRCLTLANPPTSGRFLEWQKVRLLHALLEIPLEYDSCSVSGKSAKVLSPTLKEFLISIRETYTRYLDMSTIHLIGDAATLMKSGEAVEVPPSTVIEINFYLKEYCDFRDPKIYIYEHLREEMLKAGLFLEQDQQIAHLKAGLRLELDQQMADKNDSNISITLPTEPNQIKLNFVEYKESASYWNGLSIDLLHYLPLDLISTTSPISSVWEDETPFPQIESILQREPKDVLETRFVPKPLFDLTPPSASSSASANFSSVPIKTQEMDRLILQIGDSKIDIEERAQIAISLFSQSPKWNQERQKNAAVCVRKMTAELIQQKNPHLAFEVFFLSLKRISFSFLEDRSKIEEAPCTELLLNWLFSPECRMELGIRFDCAIEICEILLNQSQKANIDRRILTKVLLTLSKGLKAFFLHVPYKNRKAILLQIVELCMTSSQRITLLEQQKFRSELIAVIATEVLFQEALTYLRDVYKKKQESGSLSSELNHFITEFMTASLVLPKSVFVHYWKELLHFSSEWVINQQSAFDLPLHQKMKASDYFVLESELINYPFVRFVNFFKAFAMSLRSSCDEEVLQDVERMLLRGLGRIADSDLTFTQKQGIVREVFSEALLKKYPSLRDFSNQYLKEPSARDFLDAFVELFPTIAQELGTLCPDVESYKRLGDLLSQQLRRDSAFSSDSQREKVHFLFISEEKKLKVLVRSDRVKWGNFYSCLISQHISLLGGSKKYYKYFIDSLTELLALTDIPIEDFRTCIFSLGILGGVDKECEEIQQSFFAKAILTDLQKFYCLLLPITAKFGLLISTNRWKELEKQCDELFKLNDQKYRIFNSELKREVDRLLSIIKEKHPNLLLVTDAQRFLTHLIDLAGHYRRSETGPSASSSSSSGAVSVIGSSLYESSPDFEARVLGLLKTDLDRALFVYHDAFENSPHSVVYARQIVRVCLGYVDQMSSSEYQKKHFYMSRIILLLEGLRVSKQKSLLLPGRSRFIQATNREIQLIGAELKGVYFLFVKIVYTENTVEAFIFFITFVQKMMRKHPDSRDLNAYGVPAIVNGHEYLNYLHLLSDQVTGQTILLKLSKAHLQLRDFDRYIKLTEMISYLDVSDWQNLGEAYMHLNQWEKASLAFSNVRKNSATLSAGTISFEASSSRVLLDINVRIKQLELIVERVKVAEKMSLRRVDSAFNSFQEFIFHYLSANRHPAPVNAVQLLSLFSSVDMKTCSSDDLLILSAIIRIIIDDIKGNHSSAAIALFIEAIDWVGLDSLTYEKFGSVSLPLELLQPLELLHKGGESEEENGLRLIMTLYSKLITCSYNEICTFESFLNGFLQASSCSTQAFNALHKSLIFEEKRLQPLALQEPQLRGKELRDLLESHYLYLISSLRFDRVPSKNIEEVFNFLEEVERCPNNQCETFFADGKIKYLHKMYHLNIEINTLVSAFKESRKEEILFSLLKAFKELHVGYTDHGMLFHILYNNSCVWILRLIASLQALDDLLAKEVPVCFFEKILPELLSIFTAESIKRVVTLVADGGETFLNVIEGSSVLVHKYERLHEGRQFIECRKIFTSSTHCIYLYQKKVHGLKKREWELTIDGSFLPHDSMLLAKMVEASTHFAACAALELELALAKNESFSSYCQLLDIIQIQYRNSVERLLSIRAELKKQPSNHEGDSPVGQALASVDIALERVLFEIGRIYTSLMSLSSIQIDPLEKNALYLKDPTQFFLEGLQFFEEVHRKHPESDEAIVGVAICLRSNYLQKSSLDCLKRGNPQHPRIFLFTLKELDCLGLYREFVITYANGPKLEVENPTIDLLLAYANKKIHRLEEAERCYEKITRLSSDLMMQLEAQRQGRKIRQMRRELVASAAAASDVSDGV